MTSRFMCLIPAVFAATFAAAPLAVAQTADQEFKTVATAQAHCPSDTVVWSTLSAKKTYHTSDSDKFGKKSGAYLCQKDADAAGLHAADD